MGQITLATNFGKALKELAADPRFKIFVEIGTWDGEGSTKCLVEGLESRAPEDASGAGIFSFETNKMLWMVASRYWQDRNPPLRILWARLGERMMSEEKVRAHHLFSKIEDHFNLYYKSDKDDFTKAPRIRMRKCDVAVLDGGEFCGEGDWDAIRALKPKVVALDDIHVMKNADLYDLLGKAGWIQKFGTPERNGAAIMESPGEDDKFYPALSPAWKEPEHCAEKMSVTSVETNGSAAQERDSDA